MRHYYSKEFAMKKHLPRIAWIVVGFLLFGPLGAAIGFLGHYFYTSRKASKSAATV